MASTNRRHYWSLIIACLVLASCAPPTPAAPLAASPTPPLIPTDIPVGAAVEETSQPQGPVVGVTAEQPRIVTLRYLDGLVGVGSEGSLFLAVQGQSLFVMEDIVTGPDSRVILELDDGTLLILGEQSWLTLAELRGSPDVPVSRLFLNAGSLYTFKRGDLPRNAIYEVGTPNAVASIQGTYMSVEVTLALASPTILTPTLISSPPPTRTLTAEETLLPTLTLDYQGSLSGLTDFMYLASRSTTTLLSTTVRTIQGSTELVAKASGDSLTVNAGQAGTVGSSGNLSSLGMFNRDNVASQTIKLLQEVGENDLAYELIDILKKLPTPLPTPINLPPAPTNTPTPTLTLTPSITPIPAPTNTPAPTNSPPVITVVNSRQVGDVTTGITVYIDIHFKDADGNAYLVDFQVLSSIPNPPNPAVVDENITVPASTQQGAAMHTSVRTCPVGVSNALVLGITLVDRSGARSNTMSIAIGC